MSHILDLLLDGKISLDTVVKLLEMKKSEEQDTFRNEDGGCGWQDFVPYFLNYLRDQTLHLLQSCKSATPSPAKTPVLQKKSTQKAGHVSSRRVQLFGSCPHEVFSCSSPLLNMETPAMGTQDLNSSHVSGKGYQERSKHRFSLGEFIVSPENSSGHKTKSVIQKENSPAYIQRLSGKKKHSMESTNRKSCSPAPIFSLNNSVDFPPMLGDSTAASRKTEDLSIKEELTSSILKNSPNFDNLTQIKKNDKTITKSRRISFTTLPQEGSGDACQSPSRRIKPTPVIGKSTHQQSKAFTLSEGEEKREPLHKNTKYANEKYLLRQEKAKRMQNEEEESIKEVATPSKSYSRRSDVGVMVTADLNLVKNKHKLDMLVHLYSVCFKENLLPNISEEFYFLMQLLTCQKSDRESSVGEPFVGLCNDAHDCFDTVHNAVYFAVRVLEKQISFLNFLDRGTIRMMSENCRISAFSTTLMDWLTSAISNSLSQSGPILPKSPIGGVSFQAETDNRKNFPSDQSFHLFKKQRDVFYEMLREWDSNHTLEGWSMLEMMTERIQALVNFKTDLANYLHFSRLFHSQLITMCTSNISLNGNPDDENIDLLSQLMQSNPQKYKRLQERFSRPLSLGGPCPPPSFPGCQEFFHDFIIAASSPVFNQHLINIFSSKIESLNELSFSLIDADSRNNEDYEQEQKELFISSLLTLRLLGKFLGFLTFLPYQSFSKLPEDSLTSYVNLRKNHQPPIDISLHLLKAYKRNRLVLTVPWIVEFLSMMDTVAPTIDCYHQTLLHLLCIHRCYWKECDVNAGYSRLLVCMTISWLLQNSVIPVGFFFSDVPRSVKDLFQISDIKPLQSLDVFVNQKVLYKCCAYLGEMKSLLSEFSMGNSCKNYSIRKITPVSAGDFDQKVLSHTQIQVQLEENFFHNHPASLKKTVDFVADRTASNYIKKFRSTMLQKSLRDSKSSLLLHLQTHLYGSPTDKTKDKLQTVILKISQEHCSQVKDDAGALVYSYCNGRIRSVLPLLLPDEQSFACITMTSGIALRLAQDKVHQWINKHIHYGMYQTELSTELDKIIKLQTLDHSLPKASIPWNNKQIDDAVSCKDKDDVRSERIHIDAAVSFSKLSQTDMNFNPTHTSTYKSLSKLRANESSEKVDVDQEWSCPISKVHRNEEVHISATKNFLEYSVCLNSAKDREICSERYDNRVCLPSTETVCHQDFGLPASSKICEGKVHSLNTYHEQKVCDVSTQLGELELHLALRNPSDVLIDIKDILKMVLLEKTELDLYLIEVLQAEILAVLQHNKDLLPGMEKSFALVIIDLIMTIICAFPLLWTKYNKDQMYTILQQSSKNTPDHINLLSCFGMEMLAGSQVSWTLYTELIINLLHMNLLTCDDIQSSCGILLTKKGYLDQLGTFLCDITEHFDELRCSEKKDIDFSETLEVIYQQSDEESDISLRIISVLKLENHILYNDDTGKHSTETRKSYPVQ